MKLQAEMLKVIYKDEKFETIEKIKVIPRSDYYESYKKDMNLGIKNNSEIFISKNHFRFIDKENNRNRTLTALGFKIVDENADNFVLFYTSKSNTDDFTAFKSKMLENGEKYFFDEPIIKKEKIKGKIKVKIDDALDKATVGYVNPGSFYIWVFEKGLADEEKINAAKKQKPFRCFVLPSSLSLETFKEMINEIADINRNLLLAEKAGKQSIGLEKERTLFVKNINECLLEIEPYLNAINKNPKTTLISDGIKMPLNKIKKFTYKTIFEYGINNQSAKFSTLIYKESLNIYEHRMIRYALLRLKNYVENRVIKRLRGKIEQYPLKIKELENAVLEVAEKYYPEKNYEEKLYCLEKLFVENKNSNNYKFKIFETLISNFQKDFTENKLIRSDISLEKRKTINSSKKDMYTVFCDKGYLCSTYILEKGYNVKNEERANMTNINSSEDMIIDRYIIKLETNDLEQHYKLYYIFEKILTNNKIDLEVELNNVQTYKKSKEQNGFTYYDFHISIKKIYSVKINDQEYYKDVKNIEKENFKKLFFQKCVFSNIDLVESEIKSLNTIKNKFNKIKENFNSIDQNNKDKNLLEKINNFLKLPVLQVHNSTIEYWKSTQIFNNDYRYNKIYMNLHNIDVLYHYTGNYMAEKIIHEKLDKLYEYWTLIKMIDILIREQHWELYGVDNVNRYKDIICNILKPQNKDKNSSIILFKRFEEYDLSIKLEIFYDTTVWYRKDRDNRPDFRFVITVTNPGGHSNTKSFYCDTKYRKYDEMGCDLGLNKDICDVAIKKYIESYKDNEVFKATASFIIHTDENKKYTYWGGHSKEGIRNKLNDTKDNKRQEYLLPEHRYGAFSFLPGKTDNFITFMKLIMEYHFRSFDLNNSKRKFDSTELERKRDSLYKIICWECGSSIDENSINELSLKKGYKYHMCCSNCGHFWVKNHCAAHGHTLIKHVYHNYHELEDGLWYVKCPECDDTDTLY